MRVGAPSRTSLTVAALWAYPLGVGAWWFVARRADPGAYLSPEVLVPAQLVALGLVARRIHRSALSGAARLGWWLCLGGIAIDTIATILWSHVAAREPDLYGGLIDDLFILNYLLMTGTTAAFFVAKGGTYRRPGTWVDGATIALGLVAAMLPFLLHPLFAASGSSPLEVATTVGYTVGIVAVATSTALLLQVLSGPLDRPLVLVAVAYLLGLATDVWAIAANVRGHFVAGGLENLGYCVVEATLASAAVAGGSRARAAGAPEAAAVDGFVPVLAVLLAVVVVLGAEAAQAGFSVAAAAALTLVGAGLLFARQLRVRHELRRLNNELAARAAEARLTELVRRSQDVIAIVGPRGELGYLSPASESVLGMPPAALVGTPAAQLLGEANAEALGAFIAGLAGTDTPHAEIELRLVPQDARGRTLLVIGSDQVRNPLIAGVALTIRDVTEQRTLEREVLEIATHERQRLCGEIHDGLGQELAGISLLLKSVATGPTHDASAVKAALQPIVVHVNGAIATARSLAHGLSPLQVVQGSLSSALSRLVAGLRGLAGVAVRFRDESGGVAVPEAASEHLYRIAQEALANAIRHGGCTTIEVILEASGDSITLSVVDDGRGIPPAGARGDGIGLRMMGYRARLLGGSLRIDPAPQGGTVVRVTLRTSAVAPAPVVERPRRVKARVARVH